MKRLFFDTNILMDIFHARHPFYEDAVKLWEMAKGGRVLAAVSAISFNNIFYVARRRNQVAETYTTLELIRDTLHLVALDKELLTDAISARWSDFEDAIQYYSAMAFKADVIISRDDGFKRGRLPVMTASEYLALNS